MNRLLMLCAPIATVAVLVLAPAVAQAESDTYWYSHKHFLEQELPVKLEGTSSIYFGSYGFRITCQARGTGAIANFEDQGGYNDVNELRFGQCSAELGAEKLSVKVCPRHTKLEITPQDLPWYGFLTNEQQDVIEQVVFSVSCSGQSPEELPETVSGSILALVGVGKLQFGQEFSYDDFSNFLEPDELFTGVWRISTGPGYNPITAIAVED